MQTFDNITAARSAIRSFAAEHAGDVPEAFRPRFESLVDSPSPVDQIVGVGEFLYAQRDEMGEAARQLAFGLVGFGAAYAWHGLAGERGTGIMKALRRELDEPLQPGETYPDPEDDPEPLVVNVSPPPPPPSDG